MNLFWRIKTYINVLLVQIANKGDISLSLNTNTCSSKSECTNSVQSKSKTEKIQNITKDKCYLVFEMLYAILRRFLKYSKMDTTGTDRMIQKNVQINLLV